MATAPRIFVPEGLYHVTSEGVFGSNIFEDDDIKTLFSNELTITLNKYNYTCRSWSVENNQYHLVVKASEISISLFMQRLNSVFAKKFNVIKKRRGVVFCKRFASIIVQDNDDYFKTLLKYVHLNPVSSGCCTIEELCNHRWCGHAALLNLDGDDPILDKVAVFKFFAGDDPVGSYLKFVVSEIYNENEKYLIEKIRAANLGLKSYENSNPHIIGDSNFITETLNRYWQRKNAIAERCKLSLPLETIQEKVEVHCKINGGDLFRQGRENEISKARHIFAYIGVTLFNYTCVQLAEFLKVSASAVSRMVGRGSTLDINDISLVGS